MAMKRPGDSHGHKEGDRGGDKRSELDQMMLRIRRVQGPSELRPGPPNQPENEEGLPHAGPVELVMQQSDDLRHRKHKHQVEKQLDERGALILGGDDVLWIASHILRVKRWYNEHGLIRN